MGCPTVYIYYEAIYIGKRIIENRKHFPYAITRCFVTALKLGDLSFVEDVFVLDASTECTKLNP